MLSLTPDEFALAISLRMAIAFFAAVIAAGIWLQR